MFTELRTLRTLINSRHHYYYVFHIHSHSGLPGPLTEGNNYVDITAKTAVVTNTLDQTELSHYFLNQNAHSPCKQVN